MLSYNFPRWYAQEGDECAASLVSVCDSLEKQDAGRRARWQLFLSLYEGRSVNLDADEYFSENSTQTLAQPPMYNLIRSACDTAQADVAGRQRPKPMFLTTGGNWKTRRKAKKCDKFVEAQLCQRQGNYSDAWQVMLACFHDATKGGDGLAKVFGDPLAKKVRLERALPWECHVDHREARYGNPQSFFHVYDMERDLAIEAFCSGKDKEENERKKQALLSARESKVDSNRVAQCIRIREGWRLPIDDDNPGKHCIAVENCGLFEEDWTRSRFPFIHLQWNAATLGFWGVGMAEEGQTQQENVNDIADRLYERIKICSTRVTYFNPLAVKREELEASGGEAEVFIPLKDMSQMPQTPPPSPASPAEFQAVAEGIQRFYEMRGVSQMTANSQKPPGVNAAVAMQTLNDIQTVRFLPKARAYETSFEDLGQLILDAAKDIADMHGGFLVNWPGKRFLETIDFKEVNLDEDMYQIRVAPVSQFSRDPAAILELASELRQNGDITRETYLGMIGLPDFEDMLNRETAEAEWIRDLLDRYLDATDDAELEELGGFEEPEPFISNIPGAAAICVSIYWEAKRDKAPEYCLNNIRKFIAMLKASATQQPTQEAAATQASAGGMLAPGADLQSLRQNASLLPGGDAGMSGGAMPAPMPMQ